MHLVVLPRCHYEFAIEVAELGEAGVEIMGAALDHAARHGYALAGQACGSFARAGTRRLGYPHFIKVVHRAGPTSQRIGIGNGVGDVALGGSHRLR